MISLNFIYILNTTHFKGFVTLLHVIFCLNNPLINSSMIKSFDIVCFLHYIVSSQHAYFFSSLFDKPANINTRLYHFSRVFIMFYIVFARLTYDCIVIL